MEVNVTLISKDTVMAMMVNTAVKANYNVGFTD